MCLSKSRLLKYIELQLEWPSFLEIEFLTSVLQIKKKISLLESKSCYRLVKCYSGSAGKKNVSFLLCGAIKKIADTRAN